MKQTNRMSVLRSTLYEELRIWDLQGAKNKALAGVMSIVAFSGSAVTPPRYIRVDPDPKLQALAGFTYSGVVSSLALIAFFDTGILRYLYWHDLGCVFCGGKHNKYCISGVRYFLKFFAFKLLRCRRNFTVESGMSLIFSILSLIVALHRDRTPISDLLRCGPGRLLPSVSK